MEQLQNIDLILSITSKMFFILISLVILFGLYSLLKTLKQISKKANDVSLSIQATSEHIKQEVTVDNFFNVFKAQLETIVNIYLLDTARKQVFRFLKKVF